MSANRNGRPAAPAVSSGASVRTLDGAAWRGEAIVGIRVVRPFGDCRWHVQLYAGAEWSTWARCATATGADDAAAMLGRALGLDEGTRGADLARTPAPMATEAAARIDFDAPGAEMSFADPSPAAETGPMQADPERVEGRDEIDSAPTIAGPEPEPETLLQAVTEPERNLGALVAEIEAEAAALSQRL